MSEAIKPCRKCGKADRNNSGACKVCHRNRSRRHYECNRKKVAEYYRQYYASNREKFADRQREHYAINPDKFAERSSKWEQDNREKRKVIMQNRRARIKGNGGKLSNDIIETLLVRQNSKCGCCNKSLKNGYHLDHIMPIALGGKNSDDNVQLLTPKCNLSKGAKHPIDYMRAKGRLI